MILGPTLRNATLAFTTLLGVTLTACNQRPEPGTPEHIHTVTQAVNDERLSGADSEKGDWLTYGLNYQETRFSPLDQITVENVNRLGLVWSMDLGTRRGIEATPIVVDGILFGTGPWSVVYAIDVRKGALIWRYDPHVPGTYGQRVCCDVVNRGVALYKGRVYVGTIDGRLIALDAATGTPAWETVTVDQEKMYSITGAPRVVKGLVIIGNGGADFGVRGYVSAYDAETGGMVWRTYTVPGDPSMGFESEAMETAAKTWSGRWWEAGGGGTAWDAMAYDPELDLLYVGTGNGSPWHRRYRSPGGGDNLYLSSILALKPESGDLVWYFQTTPGESWDYTATQHMILTDLKIDGQTRKVLMQAPKNGFFYVLDRATGEFLSAQAYVDVNWADGIDQESGRPVLHPGSDFWSEGYLRPAGPDGRHSWTDVGYPNTPGPEGGHNWQPMAFNPSTGFVYIPAQRSKLHYFGGEPWKYEEDLPNLGLTLGPYVEEPKGDLIAWDPALQREVWRVSHDHFWNGGVLTTAGNLVFQATAEGRLVAYDARNGEALWEAPMGTGVVAPPVSYLVDGKQYITIMAGWGGAHALHGGPTAAKAGVRSIGRIFTFALGSDAPFPDFEQDKLPLTGPLIGLTASEDELDEGSVLYHWRCAGCHGEGVVSGGVTPDLRYASTAVHEIMEQIVREGLLESRGMPNFGEKISSDELRLIQAYIVSRSIAAAEAEEVDSVK